MLYNYNRHCSAKLVSSISSSSSSRSSSSISSSSSSSSSSTRVVAAALAHQQEEELAAVAATAAQQRVVSQASPFRNPRFTLQKVASLLHFQNYPCLYNQVVSHAARYFRELSTCTSKLPSKPYSQVAQLHDITLIKLCQHITGHTARKVVHCTSSKVMAFHEAAVSWARKHLGRYYFRFTDDVDILSLLPRPFRLEYTDSYRSPYQMEPLFSCSTMAFRFEPGCHNLGWSLW